MKNKCVSFLRSKKLIILILLLACSGCDSEKVGLRELKRLCEKDAGLKIYKTVEADGFYNAYSNNGITEYLINGSYNFYEFCDSSPSPSRNTLFPEPGCFKVSKVIRKSGLCDERVDKALFRYDRPGFVDFREKHCIVVEKIEKPIAKYSYHSGLKSWSAKNEVSEFIRSYVQLKETANNEILSEYISYSYNKRPGHTTPIDCPNINKQMPSYSESKLIERTIIPYKEK
ncbi:MAG: hypothetical protein R3E74_09430 [Pseudomonadales bacterium]